MGNARVQGPLYGSRAASEDVWLARHAASRILGGGAAPESMHTPVVLACAVLTLAAGACGESVVDDPPAPPCTAPAAAREALETRCDGLDNDCDGLTDLLLARGPNACVVPGALGACAVGFAGCLGGQRLCLVPAPIAEATNLIDDDCDGTTDAANPGRAGPVRARILVPEYQAEESKEMLAGVYDLFETAGIPFDAPPLDDPAKLFADWQTALKQLDAYSLAYVPGWLEPAALPLDLLQPLLAWVAKGGVLVVTKPLGNGAGADAEYRAQFPMLRTLVGATQATKTMVATRVAINGNAAAARDWNTVEERDQLATNDPVRRPIEAYLYTPDSQTTTTVFGQALAGSQTLGPTYLRHGIGKGAVYALGLDPLDWLDPRCYVNCFDPGRDLLVSFLRAALREAGAGHSAVEHTVPGPESTVILLTHDIDAPDSHNAGSAWGEAGAIQLAKMQKAAGVVGTYFVTTDYYIGYYNPGLVPQLCALGMCPVAGHSVQHLAMAELPKGTCLETRANYTLQAATVCGEVRVNLEILKPLLPAGQAVRAWRSPYLSVHPDLFQMLVASGIRYDTSYAIGDVRTNFPLSLKRSPWVAKQMRGPDVWTFPIVQEDGLGDELDIKKRTELQKGNLQTFLNLWENALRGNLGNGAWNTLLVHPSYGIGTKPSNVKVKIDATDKFIRLAQKLDVRFEAMEPAGDFWRGRASARLAAQWDPATGYAGTIAVGADAAPRYSIEFSDHIKSFTCEGGGPTSIREGRVTFAQPLVAGKTYAFVARP
ncbi:MAG: hypothetical protein EXR79_15395 [Myxococcales bacterium]|nr:hypothetical protein [Myxococcales bacterium]